MTKTGYDKGTSGLQDDKKILYKSVNHTLSNVSEVSYYTIFI